MCILIMYKNTSAQLGKELLIIHILRNWFNESSQLPVVKTGKLLQYKHHRLSPQIIKTEDMEVFSKISCNQQFY